MSCARGIKGEIVYLTTYEELQRERGEHIKPKAKPRQVYQGIILPYICGSVNLIFDPGSTLTGEKLLSIFPSVRSVNTTYPEIAIIEHATSDTAVDTCVTVANLSSVGVLRLP